VELDDIVLGLHFLNLPFEVMPNASKLPGTLQDLGLQHSRIALLYALGHEDVIRREGFFPSDLSDDDIHDFFKKWKAQPAADEISSTPMLSEGDTCTLRSIILGAEVAIRTSTNEVSVGIAESLLAAVEAFAATSTEQDILPHRERLTLLVQSSDKIQGAPQTEESNNNDFDFLISHPSNLKIDSVTLSNQFTDWLQISISTIMAHLFIIHDVDTWLKRIAGDERGFSRALQFSNSNLLGRRVLGDPRRIRLQDWIDDQCADYPVLRTTPWCSNWSTSTSPPDATDQERQDEDTHEHRDISQMRHTDRRVVSPIDVALWDKAKWTASLFMTSPSMPPVLGLGFENLTAGERIFAAWKQQAGSDGADKLIAFSFIRGVSRRRLAEYVIVVSPSRSRMSSGAEGQLLLFVSRVNRMSPESSDNLERFIASYRQLGCYYIAPIKWDPSSPTIPVPSKRHAILMCNLSVREAWEIDANDPDIVGLSADDDPVVPTGLEDPPVFRALKQLAQFRSTRQ